MVGNYHNTPSHLCDIVTEDDFPQPLYHPHSNFIKYTNDESVLLLLVKISDGLTYPSIFSVEIGLDPFLSEAMWERNQWYLTEINLLVGFRWGDEATNIVPVLFSKTDD